MSGYAPPLERSVWSDLHGRPWTISGRQYAALVRFAWLEDWLRLTQRQIAASEGYSLKGAHTFVVSMRAGGLLAVRTRRGRSGGTWIRPVRGLLAALKRRPPRRKNVSAEAPKVNRPTAETLELGLEGGGFSPGREAWRELGERFGSRARREAGT